MEGKLIMKYGCMEKGIMGKSLTLLEFYAHNIEYACVLTGERLKISGRALEENQPCSMHGL